ncbi:uncharacterized protein LOC144702437 [Wolffia australiana]
MEEVHRELEEVKMALREKSELLNTLRKVYEEQSNMLHQVKVKIGKQAEELSEKSEEISSLNSMYEDLKLSFQEKNSALKCVSSSLDQLRVSSQEKLAALHEEKMTLEIKLNEANAQIVDQAQNIYSITEEIKELKCQLLESQKRCANAQRKAEVAKDLKWREEVMMELERENGRLEEKLKWKTEQFAYLEDAKEKLYDQFQSARKEWESEKFSMVDEIRSLQKNLESKSRLANDLNFRLQMTNQAIAHKESRIKLLEIQMQESKLACENVLTEYEEAALKINELSKRDDDEIASLRSSLMTKDALLRESEHEKKTLEEENMELLASLKELREAEICEAGAVLSLKNLRLKFKSLEQEHKKCETVLKNKEKLTNELDEYVSQTRCKDNKILALESELEGSCSSLLQLKLKVEELNVLQVVLSLKYPEIQSDIEKMIEEVELFTTDKINEITHLKEKVWRMIRALDLANIQIKEEQNARAALIEKSENLDLIEQKYGLVHKELDECKEMLKKSSQQVVNLDALLLLKESAADERLRKISEELDASNSLCAEKEQQLALVRIELENSRVANEKLEKTKEAAQAQLQRYRDDCANVRRELESTLLSKEEMEKYCQQLSDEFSRNVEEKEKNMDVLRQLLFQSERDKKNEELEAEERFLRLIEENENEIRLRRNEIDELLYELFRAEIGALVYLEQSKAGFMQLTTEKEKEMQGLLELKNNELNLAEARTDEEKQSRRALVKSLELSENKCILIEKELQFCRERLEESFASVSNLEAQLIQKESSFQEELGNVNNSLDEAKSACEKKQQELTSLNHEMQKLKLLHGECEILGRELEEALRSKLAAENAFDEERNEKERLLRVLIQKERSIIGLQEEIDGLLLELSRADNEATVKLEQTRGSLLQLIDDLRRKIKSLEDTRSLEIDKLSGSLEKSLEAHKRDLQHLEQNKLNLRSYEEKLEDLSKLRSFIAELQSELETERSTRETDSSALKKSLTEMQSELEIEKQKREREKASAEEQLSTLRKSLDELQSERGREKMQAEIELSTLKKSLKETQSERERERNLALEESLDLKKSLEEVQSELEAEKRAREKERIHAEDDLAALRNSLSQIQSDLEIEATKRETDRRKSEEQVFRLKNSLAELRSEKEKERKQAEDRLQRVLAEEAEESKRRNKQLSDVAGIVSLEADELCQLILRISREDEIKAKWERISKIAEPSPISLKSEERERKNSSSTKNRVRQPLAEFNSGDL